MHTALPSGPIREELRTINGEVADLLSILVNRESECGRQQGYLIDSWRVAMRLFSDMLTNVICIVSPCILILFLHTFSYYGDLDCSSLMLCIFDVY